MNFRTFLHSTSSTVIISTAALLLSGCGGSSGDGASGTSNPRRKPSPESPTQPSQTDENSPLVLAFNGFSENGTFYDQSPRNLAGDLSAIEPANLYLYDTFINAVGPNRNPSIVPQDYTRELPASKKMIQTGNTLLNPGLAMNSSDPAIAKLKNRLTVSPSNPVILTIPAGIPRRPEAPFFPAGTKYTAVLVEAPSAPGATHGPIVSLESDQDPVQFAAFAHQQDKTFTLRVYDRISRTENNPGVRVLLSPALQPVTIQSRFVVMAADGLSNSNVNLESMDARTFSTFGFKTGKGLLQNMASAFPQLLDSNKQPLFYNGFVYYGVFCLGGKNTFNTVTLKDSSFVYPLSTKDKGTKITTLNVSEYSGFITETGKHIDVTTLNGNGTLKLIAVMKGTPTADPIVKVTTLNGVDEIDFELGVVDPAFVFPKRDIPLLSFEKASNTLRVKNIRGPFHLNGSNYDGDIVLNGKTVVLTDFSKTASLSSGSRFVRSLLSHHPKTQGIPSRRMNALIATLDPITSVHQTLGGSSAALSQHMLALHAGSPSSANHHVAPMFDHVTVSASNLADHSVASVNMTSHLSGLDLATSVYGASTSHQQNVTFGTSLTASKSMDLKGAFLIPSVAVGYSMDAFSDTSLSSNGININLTNTALNSAFARFMTSFKHEYAGLSTILSMGIEARHGMFSRGQASSDYDSISLAAESLNGMYSLIEASFTSNSSRLNITISNFNHAQIQFGLTD